MGLMAEFVAPFRGSFPITQPYGVGDNPREPAGFKAPDGSINYSGNGQPGTWHNGIDFGLPCGTPLCAACNGRVVEAGMSPSGFGLRVMIQDAQGNVILTGHMSSVSVSAGATVQAGEPIGASGDTGNSSGCHVHVSVIRPDGSYVDPTTLFGAAPLPPKPADESRITFVSFPAITQRDGPTRVWDGPSERLHVLAVLSPGTNLLCDAWCVGEPKWDNAANAWDRRWYHKAGGGWVASARVYGNAPDSQP